MKKECGPITLGEKYTDSVHNITGIATAYCTHLTGCNRICLEWVDNNDIKEYWVDETRIKDLVLEKVEDGPGNDPPRRGMK